MEIGVCKVVGFVFLVLGIFGMIRIGMGWTKSSYMRSYYIDLVNISVLIGGLCLFGLYWGLFLALLVCVVGGGIIRIVSDYFSCRHETSNGYMSKKPPDGYSGAYKIKSKIDSKNNVVGIDDDDTVNRSEELKPIHIFESQDAAKCEADIARQNESIKGIVITGRWRLQITYEDILIECYAFPAKQTILIGRHGRSDIRLTSHDVSGRHAELFLTSEGPLLRVFSRFVGVKIDGAHFSEGDIVRLSVGSTIMIGSRLRIELLEMPKVSKTPDIHGA